MSSSTPSTYVPSVANVRYSVGTDSDQFGSVYRISSTKYLQTLHILLYQRETRASRIFYFGDFLGCPACQNSKEPVYLCNQTDLETAAEISSFIDWAPYHRSFYRGERSSSYSCSPSVSHISTLFRVNDVVTNAYELFPDCGNYVLCEIDCAHPTNGHRSVVEGVEVTAETEEEWEEAEEDSYVKHTSLSAGRTASEDSFDYLYTRPQDGNNESVIHCYSCSRYYRQAVEAMQALLPRKWVFFQTRWPPVLAPQQVIDLEANYPARIPSWRGSTPRLVKDVIIFCRQHPTSDCLLLLDTLALSPWSPVLNALCPLTVAPSPSSSHRLSATTTCRQRWISLLWLTAADTSCNGFTWPQHLFGSQGSHWVHTVASLALLSNWLAWFSRMEIAAVLGQSRKSICIVCEGVATACLHPASWGCGQAPLFDVWPLWLVRLMLRSSCGLFARLRAPAETKTRCYFPLSDTDEI
ncbi:unnamed protein product [Dibothriocephalus latus]|uniref:Uncharacterized protein n=1 Tax=Dibothriocephalus latus TaxID=60516 RepID=A0A3P7LKT6_DIBLA|nr:unnamed protein product [Dibothriocephalus latus]